MRQSCDELKSGSKTQSRSAVKEDINIPINKSCSRTLEVDNLCTKSMVLSSKITQRTSEMFTIGDIDHLVSDLTSSGSQLQHADE